MALSPIAIFQNQENSLAQILQGGNQTISGIMDKAIQIGRDISNKQMQQEQDLMSQRRFETSMAERRGENLQQNMEDAQRFARGAYEFDTKFGADQAYRDQTLERQKTQDLFGNKMEEGRLAVAKGGLQLRRDELTAEEQRRADEEEAARKRAERTAGMLGVGGEKAAPVADERTLSEKVTQTGDALYSGVRDMFSGKPVRVQKPPSAAAPTEAPKLPAGVSQQSYDAAVETLRDPKSSASDRSIAVSIVRPEGTTPPKPPTALQLESADRARKDQAYQDEERASKATDAALEPLFIDTVAFPPHVTDTGKSKDAAYIAKAAAADDLWNANRGMSEKGAARNYPTAEAYAKLIPGLTAAQYANRRKAWELANKGISTTAAPASGGAVKRLGL